MLRGYVRGDEVLPMKNEPRTSAASEPSAFALTRYGGQARAEPHPTVAYSRPSERNGASSEERAQWSEPGGVQGTPRI